MLGLLRADGEAADRLPEPTLSRLGELVDAAARRGVIVTLDDRIPADSGASASVQATIYRIVQEALTNVAKHAGVMTATVVIDGDPDTFRVQVDNPAAAPAPGGTGATGWDEPADDPHVRRGLLGMRERVQLLGGSLSAGPTADGGWRVAARIPRQRHADADGASDERGTT